MSAGEELRWRQYLFEAHSEATLRDWASRLRVFRFCRAFGGHANDRDSLAVSYAFDDEPALEAFFGAIGVGLVRHATMPPQPVIGQSYRGDEFPRFVPMIPGTLFEQPRRCRVAGQSVFIYCRPNRIDLGIGADDAVGESDVRSAAAVEAVLARAPLRAIDPPVNGKHCICPTYYPDWFA